MQEHEFGLVQSWRVYPDVITHTLWMQLPSAANAACVCMCVCVLLFSQSSHSSVGSIIGCMQTHRWLTASLSPTLSLTNYNALEGPRSSRSSHTLPQNSTPSKSILPPSSHRLKHLSQCVWIKLGVEKVSFSDCEKVRCGAAFTFILLSDVLIGLNIILLF